MGYFDFFQEQEQPPKPKPKKYGPASPRPGEELMQESLPPKGQEPKQGPGNWVTDIALDLGNVGRGLLGLGGREVAGAFQDAKTVGGIGGLALTKSPVNDPARIIAETQLVQQKAKAEKELLQAEKIRQEVLEKQKQAEAQEKAQHATAQGEQFPLDLSSQNDSIMGSVKAAGVSPGDIYDAMEHFERTLGLNLDEGAPPGIMFGRLLNRPEFAEARPDFEAWGAAMGMPGMQRPTSTPTTPEEKDKADQQKDADLVRQMHEVQLLHGATREIQTWGDALLFILLSMLVKPQVAAIIFSKEAERGKLRAEFDFLREQRLSHKREVQWRKQREDIAREQAASEKKRGEDRKDRMEMWLLNFRKEWFLLQQKAAMLKAKPAKDEADPVLKSLQQDLDNWVNLAGKAAQSLDEANSKRYMNNAEALMKRIQERKAEQFEVSGE